MKSQNTITLQRSLLLLACLVAPQACFAQGQVDTLTTPVEVLKLRWEKQVRLPRNFDPSLIATNDRFGDARNPVSPTTAATAPATAADVVRAATKARSDAMEGETVFPAVPNRLPVFYVYLMKVRNTGVKTIEGVAWDYIFFDGSGNKPLGSHQFFSYQKLAQGRIVTFQSPMRSPPVRVVDASAQKNTRSKFMEKAVIECILYSDASVWRNPIAREGVCDLLKNSKTAMVR